MALITEDEVEKIKELLEVGLSYRAIQLETGISIATISRIKNNRFSIGRTYIEVVNELNKLEKENSFLKEENKELKEKIEILEEKKKRWFKI